jgi:hypothetical protein
VPAKDAEGVCIMRHTAVSRAAAACPASLQHLDPPTAATKPPPYASRGSGCDSDSPQATVTCDSDSLQATVICDSDSLQDTVTCDSDSLQATVTCDSDSLQATVTCDSDSLQATVTCDSDSLQDTVTCDSDSLQATVTCDSDSLQTPVTPSPVRRLALSCMNCVAFIVDELIVEQHPRDWAIG